MIKVQQYHVLEQQRWEREQRHEVAQSFGLSAGDYVRPSCDVSAQYNPKTLQQSREELVDGHGRGERRQIAVLRSVKLRFLHFQVLCCAHKMSLFPVRLAFHLVLRPRFLESKAEASSYIFHQKTSP